jgi:tRNA(Arg) A34 adenosine deaminase TadA
MIIRSHLHGMPTELWMAAERAICHDEKDQRGALVGCVISRNDGVLVSSRNGPSCGERMPKGHAEARCARKADKHSIAYVARVKKDGSIGLAKPCKLCRVQLRSRGVTYVFFTIGPNEWGRMYLPNESVYSWVNKPTPVYEIPFG